MARGMDAPVEIPSCWLETIVGGGDRLFSFGMGWAAGLAGTFPETRAGGVLAGAPHPGAAQAGALARAVLTMR